MDVSETNIITVDRPADFIWPGFAEPSPWLIWQLGDLDPLDALCFEPAYVAVNSVRESYVRFGDAVAVVGLGAIGLLTVKVAALAGADVIFAIDPLAETPASWRRTTGRIMSWIRLPVDAALGNQRDDGRRRR